MRPGIKEVQKVVDALVAELTAAVMQLVREALRDKVAAKTPPASRAATKRAAAKRSVATEGRPARRSAPKRAGAPKRAAQREAQPSTTRQRSAEQLEQALVRHLRGGVLLTMDALDSMGSSGEAPLVHTALERLVARGLVGVTGEGAERFIFATRGRPAPATAQRSTPPPVAPATSKRRSRPTPAAPPAILEPPAEASTAEGAPPPPTTPSGPPAGHPFVVRRKKSA